MKAGGREEAEIKAEKREEGQRAACPQGGEEGDGRGEGEGR